MQQTLQIDSIDGGIQPSFHEGSDTQYLGGIAIDPEARFNSSYSQGAMGIIPTMNTKFSGGKISAAPMWIFPSGKDTNVYVNTADGALLAYGVGTETLVGIASAGAGDGACYHNDYVYMATSADIARYGPLDNSPAFSNYAWTGAALGSQQPLSATSFPFANVITYPKHPMHVHNDGNLYFGDYISASGRPTINKIVTDNNGTNTASLRRALDLPYNYVINDIESFGNDLAILCSWQSKWTSGAVLKVGRAALFVWDTFSSVPYKQIDLSDPIGTAMINHNGILKIFSGQLSNYVRLTGFMGGNNITPLEYIGEGSPPPPGAIDVFSDQLAWGAYGFYPSNFCGVMTKGFKNAKLPNDSRNVIIQISDSGTPSLVTALNFGNTGSSKYPIVGWATGTPSYGLDRTGSGTLNARWRSKLFNIGQEFTITRIRIPLGAPVDATTSITPSIYVDNEYAITSIPVISNTVYSGKTVIDLKTTIKGSVNFSLDLVWGSTTAMPIAFPITFTVETLKDKE